MAKKNREYGVPDEENPEWTREDFARARPLKEVDPELYKAMQKAKAKGYITVTPIGRPPIVVKLGRPPVETPKVHIGFRLAADVVEGVRATGRGYNSRVEKILREALAKGRLKKVG